MDLHFSKSCDYYGARHWYSYKAFVYVTDDSILGMILRQLNGRDKMKWLLSYYPAPEERVDAISEWVTYGEEGQ